MRASSLLLSLAFAAIAAPAVAQTSDEAWLATCRRNTNGERERHCEVRESRMAATGTLEVDAAENGGVSVRSYEGSEVRISARIQTEAATDETAREMARDIRVVTENGSVRTEAPESRRARSWSVSYEILVPRRTSLEVQAQNGPISVDRVAGDMRLRTVNGPITLHEVAGDVHARTTNGPLTVRLAGSGWGGGALDAQTVNGPVTVDLPRGYRAHLEASTTAGPVQVPGSIPRERRRGWVGGGVNADLNGGGPTVRAVTTNGPVVIREI